MATLLPLAKINRNYHLATEEKYVRGYRPARSYLLAWGFLITSLIFMILESLNITPVLPYINPGQIGSAIEATLLSFALADRINEYKRERGKSASITGRAQKQICIHRGTKRNARNACRRTHSRAEAKQHET